MEPSRREILERVARGEISPEDADELLRALDGDGEPEPGAVPRRTTNRVKVRAGFGAIVVVGDDAVTEAEVEGLHSASHEDDALVIHSDIDRDLAMDVPGNFTFNFGGPRKRRGRGVRIGPGFVQIGGGRHKGRLQGSALRIRMNPALELDARLDAGSLSVSGLHAPVRARMAAGPITIEDFTHPLDVSVNAGAIRASGELTFGESRIKSDAGAVRLELRSTSNVRIVADAALGKVVLPGQDDEGGRRVSSRREATLGDGEGLLRVETAMGSINITTDD